MGRQTICPEDFFLTITRVFFSYCNCKGRIESTVSRMPDSDSDCQMIAFSVPNIPDVEYEKSKQKPNPMIFLTTFTNRGGKPKNYHEIVLT